MKGIILAGGNGTRLRPVTLEIPKPLITVRKKPILNYNIELLAAHGVDDVAVIIRPADREDYEHWQSRYGGNFPDVTVTLVEEPEAMGTLGYIFHHLESWIAGEDVVVMNGDSMVKGLDIEAMRAAHAASGAAATISVARVDDPSDYGTVQVGDGKRVKAYLEKQKSSEPGLVSAGVYVVSPVAIEHVKKAFAVPEKFLMFEKDLFPALAKADMLGAFVFDGTFFDCGTLERWERAIREA